MKMSDFKNRVSGHEFEGILILAKNHLMDDSINVVELEKFDLLEKIDVFLLQVHNDLKNIKKRKDGLLIIEGMVMEFGAVITDLILKTKQISLNLYKDYLPYGANSYPLILDKDEVVFPMAWVRKRILYGSSDSIIQKFRQLIEKESS